MVTIPLWIGCLWRLRSAVKKAEVRIIWLVITSLAAAMTTRLSSATNSLYTLTGIDDGATLIKHLLGVLTITMLLQWILAIIPGQEDAQPEPRYRHIISSRPRRLLSAAAVLVMTAAFPFANRREGPADDSTFIYAQAGHWAGSIHLICFYSYLAFALSCAAMMCADAYRRDRAAYHGHSSKLGAGLGTMAVGCSIGAFYGLIRIAYLVVRLSHRGFVGGDLFLGVVSNISLLTCILLMGSGCCSPALERMNEAVAMHDSIAQLRSMWLRLTAEVPQVVLDPLASSETTGSMRLPTLPESTAVRAKLCLKGTVGRAVPLRIRRRLRETTLMAAEFCNWTALDFRLMRRVLEICDAIMVLQSYVPTGLHELARAEARARELPPEAATAYLLYTAIRRKRAGHPGTDGCPALIHLGDDYRTVPQVTLMPIWYCMRSRSVINVMRRRVTEEVARRANLVESS